MSDNLSWLTTRSAEEIDHEIKRVSKLYLFANLYYSQLIASLPYDLAKPYLKDGTKPEQWSSLEEDYPTLADKNLHMLQWVSEWSNAIRSKDATACLTFSSRTLAFKYLLRHVDWPVTPGVNGDLDEIGQFGSQLLELVLTQMQTGEWNELTMQGQVGDLVTLKGVQA